MADVSRRSRLTIVAGSVSIVFLALTVLVVGLSWGTQSALRRQNYDDSGLASIQLRLYYEQLVAELKGLEAAPADYSLDTALLSYDILYERASSLPTRPPYPEFLDAEINALVHETHADIAAFAPAFDAAAESGRADHIVGLAQAFETLRPAVERIASRSTQLASAFRGQTRRESLESLTWLVIAVAGLMLSACAFAMLMWHSMRTEQAQIRELAKTRDEAVRASRAKSEFLAHMSHDLRTPLNAIIGFSDMIRSQAFGPLGERYVDYATHVKAAGEHLLHLIGELLDLARIEAKKIDLNAEPIIIAECADACIRLLEGRAKARSIVIAVNDKSAGAVLMVDAGKVRQMVLNLLDNAVKFSPQASEVEIEIENVADGELALTVADSGPGIPKSEIARVLEPFGQIATVDSMLANEGSGLGIPIVKGLIEMHGGTVRIDSDRGQGTRVVLTFPASRRIDGSASGAETASAKT